MAGQGLGKNKKESKPAKLKKDSMSVAAIANSNSGEILCALIENVSEEETEEETVNAAADWAIILDSSATSHLIKSHEYFWTYSPESAHLVTMANMEYFA